MKENIKDALKPAPLKKPLDRSQMGSDVAALNSLLSLLNNPELTGAEVPKGVNPKSVNVASDQRNILLGPSAGVCLSPGATTLPPDQAFSIMASDVPESSHRRSVLATAPPPIPRPMPATPKNTSKIFFTGLIGSGKDYCGEQIGAKIFGLADPLYHLAEYFFGVKVSSQDGKTLPGMRAFLQVCGQYGRGDVSEKFPYTAARACFISMIRSLGDAGRFDPQYEIDWSAYGKNVDIWLDGLNRRIVKYQTATPDSRVAITNVRFSNEFKRLQEFGFTHFHVMASPQTRAGRVKVDAAAANDTSEQLANALNNDVMKRISAQPRGAKLRVIWNCSTPLPSPRLYTVPELLEMFKASDMPEVMTGE